jgi:hypothetical protein
LGTPTSRKLFRISTAISVETENSRTWPQDIVGEGLSHAISVFKELFVTAFAGAIFNEI